MKRLLTVILAQWLVTLQPSQVQVTPDTSQIPNLTTANIYSAGQRQSVGSDGTNAGLNITCAALPSSAQAGDLAMNPACQLNWYDGIGWRMVVSADSALASGGPVLASGANRVAAGTATGTGMFVLSNAATLNLPVITSFSNTSLPITCPAGTHISAISSTGAATCN